MRITLEQFAQNIEKNGWPHTTHSYVKYNENSNKVIGACAYGQAALNLGVNPSGLHDAVLSHFTELNIVRWNDKEGLSLKEIADKVRELYPDRLDEEFDIPSNQ